MVVVRPRNKGKGLPSYAIRARKTKKEDFLGDVIESFGNIGSWDEVCNERK